MMRHLCASGRDGGSLRARTYDKSVAKVRSQIEYHRGSTMSDYNPRATTSPFDQVTRGRTSVEIDEGLRAYMLHVYNYMVLGLAILAWPRWAFT
jgi:hypothetical protein